MATKTLTTSPTAEVFLAAVKSLPKKDLEAFYVSITHDKILFENLLEFIDYIEDQSDIAVYEKRKNEPRRSLADYIKKISK